MGKTANKAQAYLIENGLGDRVLNDNKYKANTPENAKHWVYASDAMMNFLESERRQDADLKNAALPIFDVSQQSEPLFAFDKIEKELLKRISGNGLQISRFMEWLKANYGG